MHRVGVAGKGSVTTRSFALLRSEVLTTSVAAVTSTCAYLVGGYPYLARGVVGDLAGFVLLGAAGLALRGRVRHEALICLALIGLVLRLRPQWPLQLAEGVWWILFFLGVSAYIGVRRHLCD